jgi:hypothetical protein
MQILFCFISISCSLFLLRYPIESILDKLLFDFHLIVGAKICKYYEGRDEYNKDNTPNEDEIGSGDVVCPEE